jgi:hypothetical protein
LLHIIQCHSKAVSSLEHRKGYEKAIKTRPLNHRISRGGGNQLW